MPTILITGFGPFPGAPFNPTEALVRRLARERRPALADVKLVAHVFRTSYAAVDQDLPALIRAHRPDAIVMFGLATRTPHLRIEMVACNAMAGTADADGHAPPRRVIAERRPGSIVLPTPARRLLTAARTARVPAALSHDAGRYLCNYLCWRAAEACAAGAPRLAAFIHVPLLRRGPIPLCRIKKRRLDFGDVVRAGHGLVRVFAAEMRR
jgi:pyroglutamyl-peptidase